MLIKALFKGEWNENNIRFFEDSHGNPKIPEMTPYLDSLKKFNIIREKCFSSKPVGDFDYHKAFDDFKASFLVVHSDFEYLEETASLIPKVHELFFHVTSFMDRYPDLPLGLVAEQVHENVHSNFDDYASKRMIKNELHPKYAEKLKQVVVSYNSKRI